MCQAVFKLTDGEITMRKSGNYFVTIEDDTTPHVAYYNQEHNRFYVTGDGCDWTIEEFNWISEHPIKVPCATYQDGTEAQIGDRVKTICGRHSGIVESIILPHGIFTSGQVKIADTPLINAGACYTTE